MSVLIKDVDKILYNQFKSQAVIRGLKVGEALSLAMKKWLDDISTENEEEMERIRNIATYRKLFLDLIDEHEGKWLLISQGRLIGIYENMMEAVNAIEKNDLYGCQNIMTELNRQTRTRRFGMRRRREM